MGRLRDWRVLAVVAVVIAVGGLVGILALRARAGDPRDRAADSQGGLVVQTSRDDDIRLDPKRPLRCFVGGLFVGEMPVSACAMRNGVGVGALDVGVDSSGALAGAKGPSAGITPLPPAPPPAAATGEARESGHSANDAGDETTAVAAPIQTCWRYSEAAWTPLPEPMTRTACLQSLYDGTCLSPGAASYGRWGDRTLRLTAGRIEVSADNRVFRTLAQQGPGCSVG